MNSSKESSILYELNHEEVMRQIPLMIYLAILCICGTAGNALVCYIFAKKYTSSTYNTFVTALSIVDMLTCCTAIPVELIVQFLQYTFDSTWLCKIGVFLNTWTTITSDTLLFCIAFDRYRKVCKPFSWQVSFTAAKRVCLFSVAIGIVCTLLSPIVYDIQKSEQSVHNITIAQCEVTENMKETLFPLINNIVFTTLFVGGFIATICFYCRIAMRVRQQAKWRPKTTDGNEIHGKEIEIIPVSKETVAEQRGDIHAVQSDTTEGTDKLESVSTNEDKGIKQETLEIEKVKNHDKNIITSQNVDISRSTRRDRTTLIMSMVSLGFIISYVPLISLLMTRTVDEHFEDSLNDFDRSVYKFFLRSYFLNSAINPVIYGILDPRFRRSCKLICSCTHVLRKRQLTSGLEIHEHNHE